MKTYFIDKINKKNFKKVNNKRTSIHLDVNSFISDDSDMNFYNVTIYVDGELVVSSKVFPENKFDSKGDIVVAMVSYVLEKFFIKLHNKGIIDSYGVY